MKVTVSVSVGDVDVDVDLSLFDTDDLQNELRGRGVESLDMEQMMQDMFDAFKTQDDEKAMSLAKQIAAEYTGRIL